jgi:hypothetical protein
LIRELQETFLLEEASSLTLQGSSIFHDQLSSDNRPPSSLNVRRIYEQAAHRTVVLRTEAIEALERGDAQIEIKMGNGVITVPREEVEQAIQKETKNHRSAMLVLSGILGTAGFSFVSHGAALRPRKEGNSPASP